MEIMGTCTLISFDPDAHEAGADPVAKRTEVKCTEKTVGQGV